MLDSTKVAKTYTCDICKNSHWHLVEPEFAYYQNLDEKGKLKFDEDITNAHLSNSPTCRK